MREVRYYDKARLELPRRRRRQPVVVTNGLLVWELINGQVQLGIALRRANRAANVAGRPGRLGAPTYGR
jgi:hypothetical protein